MQAGRRIRKYIEYFLESLDSENLLCIVKESTYTDAWQATSEQEGKEETSGKEKGLNHKTYELPDPRLVLCLFLYSGATVGPQNAIQRRVWHLEEIV